MENTVGRVGETFRPEVFRGEAPDCQPVYAWVWNDEITREGIVTRLKDMQRAGIRGVYVLAEPKNFRPGVQETYLEPDYLSEEFLSLTGFASEYARSLGMEVWLYDEGGWPSGSACGSVPAREERFRRKELRPEARLLPAGEPLTLQQGELAAFTENGRMAEGTVLSADTEITVYAVRVLDGLAADCIEPGAGDAFVEETHKKYENAFGETLCRNASMMFTDEPGTGRYPWPTGFGADFQARFGYDILEKLPDLWDTAPETAKTRQDYRRIQGELFQKRFLRPIGDWCRRVGLLSTGHLDQDHVTDGCLTHAYGSVLPLLRRLDVPGMDTIWRQIGVPKDGIACKEGNGFFERFVSSAADQNGRGIAMSETFGVYGDGMGGKCTRFTLCHQLVRGINLFNFMLLSYSSRSALALVERPTWMPQKPGWEHLRAINDYTARASYLMLLGMPGLHAALYFPAEELWAEGEIGKRAQDGFEAMGQRLEQNQVEFDILDEEGLRQAELCDGVLRLGIARYDTLFVPEGVKLPSDLEEKAAALGHAPTPSVETDCSAIRVRTRKLPDGGAIYMLLNESDVPLSAQVRFPETGERLELDAGTGRIYHSEGGVCFLPCEAKFFLFPPQPLGAEKRKTDAVWTARAQNFTLSVRHEMLLTPEGLEDLRTEGEKLPVQTGPWAPYVGEDFSGEAVYETVITLPEPVEKGETYRLTMDHAEDSVRVTVNGKEIAILWVEPWMCEFSGDDFAGETTLCVSLEVANTPVNAIRAANISELYDKAVVGWYHAMCQKYEKAAAQGGLWGPVTVSRVK